MLYFDHNSSSPVRPEVLELVARVERDFSGNPSSQHAEGRKARGLLEESRESLATLLGARAAEIVFTSGGTEANRVAIEGAAAAARPSAHAVVAAIEHPSVLGVYSALERGGRLRVTLVGAREDGAVRAGDLAAAMEVETAIVSLQLVNNETGVVQAVKEVAAACRERPPDPARSAATRPARSAPAYSSGSAPEPVAKCFGSLTVHVDAVQALGKIVVRPEELGADLLSISSHKVGGPKGAGALWIRAGARFVTPLHGGPQERGLRPGTENLAAIAGFVRAAELAEAERLAARSLEADAGEAQAAVHPGIRLRRLLGERVAGIAFNGDPSRGVPGTVNVSFAGVPAELLVIRLDQEGVAASMGSACASGSREPSHVLRAMGLPAERVRSAVRLSTGWSTTLAEVEELAGIIARVVPEMRAALGSDAA